MLSIAEFKPILEQSIRKVEKWVEEHDYKGYEPFDGLSSFFRPLTFGNLFLDRILMQLVRQSPLNLRPLLGIKPLDSTIGRGYMAWGYLTMFKASGDGNYKIKAKKCLQWLIESKSPGYEEFSWGKHFDFASRGGRYPKFEPITVWTCLIGMTFLEAYEILKKEKYLEVAESICRWVLNLARNETENGICFSYTASGDNSCTIHNHSMLAAAMLARTAKHVGKKEYLHVAESAMRYSCSKQLPDGGWFYGEDPMYHWIDNFHTGYNLDSLKCYIESTGDMTYQEKLRRGFEFFKKNFFEESGRPKYYHNRTYPVDSQCASQAIDTLANFSEFDKDALSLAIKVASWTIDNMQDKNGYFYYRQYPMIKAKTPMLHWAQATIYKASTVLLSKLTYLQLNAEK
jgi:rhamnogalacturonyl hydrolase YesR